MEAKKMKMVYTITEGNNGKKYWTKIGVGFVNQDGSINLKLDAIPMGGQGIQIRDWEPDRRPDAARASGPGPRYTSSREPREETSHEPAEFNGLA